MMQLRIPARSYRIFTAAFHEVAFRINLHSDIKPLNHSLRYEKQFSEII
jgi:hypothetical protein